MSSAACRLCTSADLSHYLAVQEHRLDRCGSCGFVQVRQQPSQNALRALYADGYFKRGKYDEEFAQRREGERRLELLERARVSPGGRVLDAGCATGDFLSLGSQRYEMWGLDVSAYATEVAARKNPSCSGRIFTGFVEEQSFEPEFFDAIVMWDVVEHIWDPKSVLRRLVSHLRPGGSLILSTPDIGALTARIMRKRWAFMTVPEHLGFFSPRSLRFLLETELGLDTTSSATSGKWVNLGFLAYKLRRVFPQVPASLVSGVQRSPLASAAIYVPTADIRYVAARKPVV